ncbi:AAA family ATPase [Paenibacillus lutrae]|uniref:AAA family ATPase n=1 Tax=Paenibacillus lutrae TaxID=2078573 RepID=A0A7X3JZT8_9BACL|nr:AAA family ATPase [Paenibacillus lutrae]MVP00400.1 AAA family ATPase [Paenibacillus lutrae]
MNHLLLVWVDHHAEYANRLEQFVRTSEYRDKLQIRLFTQLSYASQCLKEADPNRCVLVCSEPFREAMPASAEQFPCLHMYVSEDKNRSSAHAGTLIYRYQPLRSLLKELMLRQTEYRGSPVSIPSGGRSTRILSLYSSVGGYGKSVTALNMAAVLSSQHKSVLYLSLETVSASGLLLQDGKTDSFSRLLYLMKKSPETVAAYVDALKSRHPAYGFDYLMPLPNIHEADELSADDVGTLLAGIRSSGSFDYVVLDLESSVHPRNEHALSLSDTVVWLVADDLYGLNKTRQMKNIAGVEDKTCFVLNKYTGITGNDMESFGVSLYGKLPYIPEWKTITEPAAWVNEPVFTDGVNRLAQSLLEGAEFS